MFEDTTFKHLQRSVGFAELIIITNYHLYLVIVYLFIYYANKAAHQHKNKHNVNRRQNSYTNKLNSFIADVPADLPVTPSCLSGSPAASAPETGGSRSSDPATGSWKLD